MALLTTSHYRGRLSPPKFAANPQFQQNLRRLKVGGFGAFKEATGLLQDFYLKRLKALNNVSPYFR